MNRKILMVSVVVAVLMVGILLVGCATKSANQVVDNSAISNDLVEDHAVVNNVGVQPDKIVSPGTVEFSVPSELPIAYVGQQYTYSFCNPQPTGEPGTFTDTKVCGLNATSLNPKGGTPPYGVHIQSATDWFVSGLYVGSSGILNFTPQVGDEGEYTLEVCVSDSGDNYNTPPSCKNTTLYIMSDTVTIKGEGELTHYLLLKLNSIVTTRDFRGNEDEKDIKNAHYVPAANFLFTKVTAEVSAAPPYPSCEYSCGGGSFAGQDVLGTDNSVSVIADGNAACGRALGPEYPGDYNVDYYMVGYVGYNDNTFVALNITNTGTKVKAIDVELKVSSEVDSRSQNYFDVRADAVACIGDHCIKAPTGKPGDVMVNSTVYRVLVRPGSHWIYVGSMNDNFANTNMLSCPSFVKASSKVTLSIVPADINDGKKAIGSIWSYHNKYESGSGVK